MSAQTESVVAVNFDNLVLKRWLHCVGPVRRCELLQKLKTELQNLGLSRRQVRRALIQLATKPRVVLIRQPTSRRDDGRPRRLFLEDEEEEYNKISTSCCTNNSELECSSQQEDKDAQKPDSLETGATKETEYNERPTRVRSPGVQESVISSRSCHVKSNDTSTSLHPFDKTLEQLDKLISSKMNMHEKSVGKRSSVIVSADTTTRWQNKGSTSNKSSPSHKKSTCSETETQRTPAEGGCDDPMRKTPDLVSDKVGRNVSYVPFKDKKHRIKLNLNSCSRSSNKKADNVKPNVSKKFDVNEKTAANVEADSMSIKIRCSSEENNRSRVTSQDVSEESRTAVVDTKVPNKEDNAQKRRLHEERNPDYDVCKRKKISASFDEAKKSNDNKRKKMKGRFRVFFGDCRSVSEDEQEEDILCKKFKRRRKKDSVDSCDSGVCTTESNASNCIEILKEFQKAVPDSTVQEEFGEDTSKVSNDIEVICETRNLIKDESVETTSQVKNVESVAKVEEVESVTEAESIENIENVAEIENIENIKNYIEAGSIKNIGDKNTQNVENITNVGLGGNVTKVGRMEKVTEAIKATQRKTYETDSNRTVTENIIQEKLVDTSDESDCVEIVTTTSGTQRPQKAERSKVDAPLIEAEIGNVKATATEGSSKPQKSTVDYVIDLGELLRMALDETCQITSNGNVISIQENIEKDRNEKSGKENIDENSNLKVVMEAQPDNQNLKRKEQVRDTSNEINKSVLPASGSSSVAEKEDTPPTKVPVPKLRVLSSAELGSRWCPTPVNPPTVPQFSYNVTTASNSFSQATTTTTAATTTTTASLLTNLLTQTSVATSISTEGTASRDNTEVLTCLSKIHDLIVSIRTSSLPPNVNFNYLLVMEFSKLHEILQVNYTTIAQKVINKFNGTLFTTQPLSGRELFQYSPYLRHMCLRENNGRISTETAWNHTTYQNAQSVHTTTVQPGTQNTASVSVVQNQCTSNLNQPPASAGPTKPQQTFQEKVIPQPQNNLTQNGAPTNPMANPLFSMQQSIYRMEMQRPPSQQKTPRAYIRKSRLANAYAVRGVLVEPVLLSSTGTEQSKQTYVPTTNTPFTNQQNIYTPPPNAFVTNHLVQQNVNSTQVNQQPNINLAHVIQQQNINPARASQQQNVHHAQRIQQHANSVYVAQQQTMPPLQKVQQPYINSTHIVQQQNIHSIHTMQQQTVNPAQRLQQQNINPAQRVQQQSMNLAQRVQQQNMNPAQQVQQQNMNSAQRLQQNMNPAQRMQPQNMNPAQRVQQQTMNPAQRVQPQNNTAQRIQQQNTNITYLPQQQIIDPTLGFQQQTIINPGNQEFQKTVSGKFTYDTHGTVLSQSMPYLFQNVQQSVPVINYTAQSAQNVFVKTAPQVVPKNTQQNEQLHQKVLPQAKMKVPTNFVPEQMMPPPPPYPQAVHSSKAKPSPSSEKKQVNAVQISLESTLNRFNVLRYLSDIQKLMLNQQMEFYFNCTTWLDQQTPGETWDAIWLERWSLLHFQTLLKHIVEKTVKDLQSKCQENTAEQNLCLDIKIGAPKQLCIIVEETNGVHCQVKVSTPEQTRCEIVNSTQGSETCQEDMNMIPKQLEKQQKTTGDLQNTQFAGKMHQSRIDLKKEEIDEMEQNEKNVQPEKLVRNATLEAKNGAVAVPISETQTSNNKETHTSNNNSETQTSYNNENHEDRVEKNSESSTNLCSISTKEKDLSESAKTVENTVRSSPKGLVASDSKESNKDTIQMQATQLVTVEISPNNDEVKVIDVNTPCATDETVIKIRTDKPKESEQKLREELHSTCTSPSLEETTGCEPCAESILDSSDDDIKYSSYTNIDTILIEETLESYIEDVRSISLEAFEKMEGNNNQSMSSVEGHIEEEEIKICLRCNKPSTVACSNCLEAKYCSKKCSDLHWQDEHYKNCIPVEKSLYLI